MNQEGEAERASGGGAIVFIFVTVALDVMVGTIAFPVFPKLIGEISPGNPSHISELFGALATLFAATQFFASPVQGALSDSLGRRPIILASCIGLGIDSAIIGFAPNLVWLFAARFVAGALAASMTAATAYLADVAPPEQRTKVFGYLFAAIGVGQSIGPAFGGWLATFGTRTPFFVASGICILNAVYGWFILPESLPAENRTPFSVHHFNPVAAMLALGRAYPRLLSWAPVLLVFALGATGINVLFVLYTQFRYGWSPRDIGLVITAYGLGVIAVQGLLVPPISKRLGDYAAMLVGYAFQVGGIVECGLAATGAQFYIGLVMLLFGIVASPAQSAIISRLVNGPDQGKLSGATRSLYNLAAIAAPALFTFVFARSMQLGGKSYSGIAFLVAAALMACAGLAAARLAGRAQA